MNFMLDLDAKQYVGVDVTNLFLEEISENQGVIWLHWYRCAMVLKTSPNHTTQEIMFVEYFLFGNP